MTVEARKTFHISCSDAQWAEAKRRAAAAGRSASAHLVERALDADLSIFDERPEPLVLGAEDQRRMCGRVEFMTGIVDPFPAWQDDLDRRVAFLHDAKVTELVAEGRYDELFLAFGKLHGPERAEALLARAVKEWYGAESVEVKVRGPTRRM